MNFIELCEEVGSWSVKNFGNQPADNPLLGVLEEIGEISHSYLKSLQGIRGSEKEHVDAMKDGVGDALVFLADFCYRANLVKSFVGRNYLHNPIENLNLNLGLSQKPHYFLFKAGKDVGKIYDYYSVGERVSYGIYIEMLIDDFSSFCKLLNLNFAECVTTTWEIVKQRDWTKNKQTGQVDTTLQESAVKAVMEFITEREKDPTVGNRKI